jgi:hypothetical protein
MFSVVLGGHGLISRSLKLLQVQGQLRERTMMLKAFLAPIRIVAT